MKQEEEKVTLKSFIQENKSFVLMFIIGLSFVFVFYGGALLSCLVSGGSLNGLTCVGLTNMGSCNIGDQEYIITDYYKALNENGTLSEEWYIKENDTYQMVE